MGTIQRGSEQDRDLFRRLTETTSAQALEDEEQAAYLRQWSAEHPDASGCGATAALLLAAVVGLAAIVIVEVMA